MQHWSLDTAERSANSQNEDRGAIPTDEHQASINAALGAHNSFVWRPVEGRQFYQLARKYNSLGERMNFESAIKHYDECIQFTASSLRLIENDSQDGNITVFSMQSVKADGNTPMPVHHYEELFVSEGEAALGNLGLLQS